MLHNRLAKLREARENGEDGFTLIELLVVVVIIGILIAIAIPVYLNYTKGSNDTAAQSDLRGAISTLEACNSSNNAYPTGTTGALPTPVCTGQSIKTSAGTTLTYYQNSGATAYIIEALNTKGNSTIYCYSSAAGGSVAKSTATAVVAAYQATCPA